MTSSVKTKSVSLTFRGFRVDPGMVERLMGAEAKLLGRAGSPVKPGIKGVLRRSFAEFSMDFEMSSRLDQMIPSLLDHLGGVENIVAVRDQISPEFFEINFVLPIKYSDEQEGGFISMETIADVFSLKCSLSFEFI